MLIWKMCGEYYMMETAALVSTSMDTDLDSISSSTLIVLDEALPMVKIAM